MRRGRHNERVRASVSFFSLREGGQMARPTSRVSRVLMTGPLAPFTGGYGQELRARGYTPLSVVAESRQVARLSRWLEAGGMTAADLSGGRVEESLRAHRPDPRRRHTHRRSERPHP